MPTLPGALRSRSNEQLLPPAHEPTTILRLVITVVGPDREPCTTRHQLPLTEAFAAAGHHTASDPFGMSVATPARSGSGADRW
jgi:hypothetical protein